MKRLIAAVLATLLCVSAAMSQQKVGLVLSGGGAKGIAHVGIIKALEENDIPIDYITGTSMGAIVGALYSCGYSPEQMLELFTSKDFADWSTGTLNRNKLYYSEQPALAPQLITVNFSKPDSANIFSYIPANLISPMPMNVEFLRLFGPYSLQCREKFDNLFVPYRCVTSDIYHKHKIVCRDGSLGEAVRQSMSFPLVFKPIERDGILVYDGGIYDNFPVDVMREEFKPDFIIGSCVSSPNGKPQPGNVYSQLEDMIIQNNDYSLPSDIGVKIDVPVLKFGVLDFGKAKEIYDIGYKTGLAMVDSIKQRCASRRPLAEVSHRREAFAAKTPELAFTSVEPKTCDAAEAEFLKYMFAASADKPLGIDGVEDAYYQIVSSGIVSDLEPTMKLTPQGETLLVQPDFKTGWNVGIGGWLTSATNSMLYLSGNYTTLNFQSLSASLRTWIGQSYMAAMVDAKLRLKRRSPSYLALSAVASRNKFYNDRHYFYQVKEPSFVTRYEDYVKLRYNVQLGRKSLMYVSAGLAYNRNDFMPIGNVAAEDVRKDIGRYNTLALAAGTETNTLNHVMYPTQGERLSLSIAGTYTNERLQVSSPEDMQCNKKSPRLLLKAEYERYFPVCKYFTIGAEGRAAGMIGPLYSTYSSTLLQAPQYAPLPVLIDFFNASTSMPSYVAAGLTPIVNLSSDLQLRTDAHLYLPIRDLELLPGDGVRYKGWFNRAEFCGQVALAYNFSNASLSVYANYLTHQKQHWSVGINFGLLMPAPKFL